MSLERSHTERSLFQTQKLEEKINKLKVQVSVLQESNDKVVRENAMLRFRLEEIEKLEIGSERLMHNNKLASSIASRELRILKIYQECAETVKCIFCK